LSDGCFSLEMRLLGVGVTENLGSDAGGGV
jgi:hypothetical protein